MASCYLVHLLSSKVCLCSVCGPSFLQGVLSIVLSYSLVYFYLSVCSGLQVFRPVGSLSLFGLFVLSVVGCHLVGYFCCVVFVCLLVYCVCQLLE